LLREAKVLWKHSFDGYITFLIWRVNRGLGISRWGTKTYIPLALKDEGASTTIAEDVIKINRKLADPIMFVSKYN